MGAAQASLKGNYGHCLGKTMDRPLSKGIFGDSIFSHIISKRHRPATPAWVEP